MPGEQVVIRIATRRDLPDILGLFRQLSRDGPVLRLIEAEAVFDTMNKYPDYHLYVARRCRTTLGTFTLLIVENLAHMGARIGFIENIIVDNDWRRKGIGKRMMQYAMQKCREAGCYKLVLSSNRARVYAHKFYENIGFDQHGYSYMVTM